MENKFTMRIKLTSSLKKIEQFIHPHRTLILTGYVVFIFLLTIIVVLTNIQPPHYYKSFLWLKERNMSNFIRHEEETFFMSPVRCSLRSPTQILILIFSSPQNFVAREAVRESWASALTQSNQIRIVFIMGRYTPDTTIPFHTPPTDIDGNILDKDFVENRLYVESIQHNDIILEDFMDTYLNLTLKTAFALKWAAKNCRRAKYVFKVDDNVYVNHENLISLFESVQFYRKEINYQTPYGLNVTRTIPYAFLGHVMDSMSINRDVNSKYFMPPEFLPGSLMPTFIRGLAYAFSGTLILPLYYCLAGGRYIPGEDVMLSGICGTKQLGLRLTHHPGFWRGPFNLETFDMCLIKEAVAVHDFDPDVITEIFETIQDSNTCPQPNSLIEHSKPGTFV